MNNKWAVKKLYTVESEIEKWTGLHKTLSVTSSKAIMPLPKDI